MRRPELLESENTPSIVLTKYNSNFRKSDKNSDCRNPLMETMIEGVFQR